MSTLATLLVAATLGVAPQGDAPTIDEIRATIQRGIPYIEEKGTWWITEKKCVTCHRTGNMVWSLGAVRQRGFAVSDQLDKWFDWSIENSLAKDMAGKISGTGNKEGLAQLLLARDLFDATAERTESLRQLTAIAVTDQQADGSWKPGGQLPGQKRPAAETTDVSTIWLALALASQGSESEQRGELDKAIAHTEASPPGKSTEWYVGRLLLAKRLGNETLTASLVEELRTQQQPNGGWGWIVGEESDALGTGIAMYALLRAGVGRDDATIQQAQRFLIGTQRDDGSWPVKGTKTGKKDRIEETAVYWGTTWAVLALVESLPGGTN